MPKNAKPDNRPGSQRDLRHTNSGRRHITSISESLARLPLLRARQSQAIEKKELIDWLRGALPAELAAHVKSAELKAGLLVVIADSAAWSGRLRYALAAVHNQIAAHWPGTLRSEVKLRPSR